MADELCRYFPADELTQAVVAARDLFLEIGVEACSACVDAAQALEQLASAGVAGHVVTSRHPTVADALLTATGVARYVGGVDGMVFGPEKVPALRRLGPIAYVGDQPADVAAAVEAGVFAVGITTGNHDEAALFATGAKWVVSGLADLPPSSR